MTTSSWAHMAKIDHLRLQRLLEENPRRTLQSLADEFGCSRERIRQVLNHQGRNWTQRIRHRAPAYKCIACGGSASVPGRRCRVCYLTHRQPAPRLVITCEHCGGSFSLRVSEVDGRLRLAERIHPGQAKRWYCSKGCRLAAKRKENRDQ